MTVLPAFLEQIAPTGLEGLSFPRQLLGAFRRKSITFCNGLTDETTLVYWIQSRTFSIDLRLTEDAGTAVTERQGWIGDTLWDDASSQLSWDIRHSYQPRNQWPEPAQLHFIGNSVLEFAPSGAYAEDWRQQSSSGPLCGLRLESARNLETGQELAMDGGVIIAGDYAAFTLSRHPHIETKLEGVSDLERALDEGLVTNADIESYEVSLALRSDAITHSTQPHRYGEPLGLDDFSAGRDGRVTQTRVIASDTYLLTYRVDVFMPDFVFTGATDCTPDARNWFAREHAHLTRNAALVR